jgi:SAM-dependent methyltransferase
MGESFWFVLFSLIIILTLILFNIIIQDNILVPFNQTKTSVEGFQDIDDKAIEELSGAKPESHGMVRYLTNDEIYDTFYCSIYDQLTQCIPRIQAELGLIIHEWTKRGDDIRSFSVLDAGCGTGIASAALVRLNAKNVIALDKSKAMLKQAQEKTLPLTTLTDEQKARIAWKADDLMNPNALQGGEITHALMLYFTIYYFPDKETVFRNLFFWVKPGGKLVIHVVNKHKFDPMLESSAPWMGFSLQKYSDTRITKSEVVFNKFKYVGEFDLQDPMAEFRETFRFNDNKVRRHRHSFKMEDMNTIVGLAKVSGWEYVGFTDLTPVGLEYMYHLHFRHP